MNHFATHSVFIDRDLLAVIQVGEWLNQEDRRMGIRPQTQRVLRVQLTTQNAGSLAQLSALVESYDWSFSAPDQDYVVNALGGVQLRDTQPSGLHQWSYTARQWQDPRTLTDFQLAQWEQVKAARDAAITAPLPTPFGVFDATPVASLNIMKAVLLAQTLAASGQTVSIDYTLSDNTVVSLNAAQITQVGLMLGGREQQVRGKATTLRAQIEAATTAEQVQGISWD